MNKLINIIIHLAFLINLVSCGARSRIEVTFFEKLKDKGASGEVSVQLTVEDKSLVEGDTDQTLGFDFNLDSVAEGDYQISISAENVSAISGVDFNLKTTTVNVTKGQSSIHVDIDILGDSLSEGDETFKLIFSSNDLVNFSSNEIVITILENDPFSVTVNAKFPNFGLNWGDMVAKNGNTINDIPDATCSGTLRCLNGGAFRKVLVTGITSCNELSATDQLGAFNWTCVEGNPIYFYSDLKKKKGLSDLIKTDGSDFEVNNVTIKHSDGRTIAFSNDAVWWTNTFSVVSLNSGASDPVLNLNTDNTIYVITASGLSRGIFLGGTNTSLIMLPGVTLSPTATMVIDCDLDFGGTQTCLLATEYTTSNHHIEGHFIGNSSLNSVLYLGTHSSGGVANHNIRKTIIDINTGNYGLFIQSSVNYSSFKNIEISNSSAGIGAVYVGPNSRYHYFNDIRISNVTTGMYLSATAWHQTITDLSIHNCSNTGLYMSNWDSSITNLKVSNCNVGVLSYGNYNVFQKVLITNSDTYGFNVAGSAENEFYRFITASQNQGVGFHIDQNMLPFSVPIFYRSLIVGNDVGIQNSDLFNFQDILVANNTSGIELIATSDNSAFSGELVFGQNGTDCTVTSSGTAPGLGVSMGNCVTADASTASVIYNESASGYFVGKVNDTANPEGAGAVFTMVSDWFNFENDNRLWGEDGTFLNTARSTCSGGENCAVYDWSLTNLAPYAKNTGGDFIADATCPATVHGDVVFVSTIFGNFLKNAIEFTDDWIGNDDGLCQSNEACYFVSNRGFDQSESSTLSSCSFVNGTSFNKVENVLMYKY